MWYKFRTIKQTLKPQLSLEESKWLLSLEKYYKQYNYEKCEQILQQKQQKYISNNIMLNLITINEWLYFLDLKSNVQYRFRKYDKIYNNIINQMYCLNYHNIIKDNLHIIIILSNKILALNIINNHKLLQKYFTSIKQQSSRKSSKNLQTKIWKIYQQQSSKKPASVKIQAIANAVIGNKIQFYQILINNINRKTDQSEMIMILTMLIYHGFHKYLQSNSSNEIKYFIKYQLCTSNQLSVQQLPQSISHHQSLQLINDYISYVHQQPLQWTDLKPQKLRKYMKLIILIAQNYYIVGERLKTAQIIADLKNILKINLYNSTNKCTQQTQLLRLLQASRMYDLNKYQQTLKLLKLEQKILLSNHQYKKQHPPTCDLLFYQMLTIAQKCQQEIQNQIDSKDINSLQLIYQNINGIQISEIDLQNSKDTIPHYYFYIGLESMFNIF